MMKHKVTGSLLLLMFLFISAQVAMAAKPELKCKADGTFKILQISDVQDDADLDPRATTLMNTLLDTEKPDLVVIAGDCIAGGSCGSIALVKKAIDQVADPMEKRNIPWAIVFGNHDQEHFSVTKFSKEDVLKYYASFPHNLNDQWNKKIYGVGNNDLLIKDSAGDKPIFAVWLIDSGDYAPASVGGYDWIHQDQIAWYTQTSKDLEKKTGHKIPGLMFFHIPLREFTDMFNTTKAVGERNEAECPAKLNSGLFSAVLTRGDVKGIFCGHDHINNYVGEWMGVQLGYDSSIGYYSYNLPDTDPRSKRSRGGRVFVINEKDPWNFQNWMRFIDGTTLEYKPQAK